MSKLKLMSGLIVALALAVQVNAGLVSLTEEFNVITFGDFSYGDWSDVKGAVAASGSVNIGQGSSVYSDNADPSNLAIVSGGSVNLATMGQVNGSITAAGEIINGGKAVTGTSSPNASLPIDFAQKESEAFALSQAMADLPSNPPNIDWGVLRFEGLTEDVNVVSMTGGELAGIHSLHFDPSHLDKIYIINVDGSTSGGNIGLNYIDHQNYNEGHLFNSENLIFNFSNTSSLAIASFYGNILAPGADVSGQWAQMEGKLVAGSFTGNIEFHDVTPPGSPPPPPPPIPEPASMLLLGFGLTGLAFIKRIKKK